MKKVITCLTAIVFMVSCFTFSALAEETNDNLPALSVEVDFPGEFSTFFGDCESIQSEQRSGNNSVGGASVVYDFTADKEDFTKGFVVMHIDAVINGKNCAFDLSGPAEGMVLTNDILWTCSLKGSMNVDGVGYQNVLSCMNKLESGDEFVVTITPPAQTPTHIRIGDLVIPPEKFYEIKSKTLYQDTNVQDEYLQSDTSDALQYGTNDIYQPIPGSIFSIIGNSFTHYNRYPNMSQSYSQRARIYQAQGYDRLAVSLKTYSADLENYMRNAHILSGVDYETGIASCTISLERVYSDDHSSIINIEKLPWMPSMGHSGGQYLIINIFFDALNALGIPTNTIQYLLDPTAQGYLDVVMFANSATINIGMPSYDYINFDNIDYGVPIIFQLYKTSSGMSTYSYSTQVTYKTNVTQLVYEPVTGLPQGYRYYVDYYDVGIANGIANVNLM